MIIPFQELRSKVSKLRDCLITNPNLPLNENFSSNSYTQRLEFVYVFQRSSKNIVKYLGHPSLGVLGGLSGRKQRSFRSIWRSASFTGRYRKAVSCSSFPGRHLGRPSGAIGSQKIDLGCCWSSATKSPRPPRRTTAASTFAPPTTSATSSKSSSFGDPSWPRARSTSTTSFRGCQKVI